VWSSRSSGAAALNNKQRGDKAREEAALSERAHVVDLLWFFLFFFRFFSLSFFSKQSIFVV